MSLQINEKTPVIIGQGQVRYDVPKDLKKALGPADIAAEAVKRALLDAGVKDFNLIERLTPIRTFADSGPMFPSPFGTSNNMPKAISEKAGLSPHKLIYSSVGGDQPQTQVMETATALYEGECSMAVICGGEAIANMKSAMRAGVPLDWSDDLDAKSLNDEGPFPDGLILSSEELRHGLMQPVQFYALAETAHRLDLDMSVSDYQLKMGKLFEPFSKTASENPYSISNKGLSAADIATVNERNKIIVEPYNKAMVAKDGVNQGAAIIMTTLGQAKRLGFDHKSLIFLTGFAKAQDGFLSERPDISNSNGLKLALQGALCSAGLKTSEIKYADLYSCFPIVVERAAQILEQANLQSFTLTGGLPFFGGAGNNYSLHAIAETVSVLRKDKKYNKEGSALVYANGGFLTKHAAGVYSTQPPNYDLQDRLVDFSHDMDASKSVEIESDFKGVARLLSYALSYKSGQPLSAVILAKTQEQKRVLARFEGTFSELQNLKKGQPLEVVSTPKGHVAKITS